MAGAPAHRARILGLRRGGLELLGGDSLTSTFDQSLLVRRQTSFRCKASASLSFEPHHYAQTAGLVCLYDTRAFHYLEVTYDDGADCRVIDVLSRDNDEFTMPLGEGGRVRVPEWVRNIGLVARIDGSALRFAFSFDWGNERDLGLTLDASILSDEHVEGWTYTGSMIGITAADGFNKDSAAVFRSFSYEDLA